MVQSPVKPATESARELPRGVGGADGGDHDGGGGGRRERPEPGVLGQAVVAAGGAMLLVSNVAPTEEPMLLGMEKDGERDADTGTVTIPFVPARSSVEAVVVFPEDPRRLPAESRFLGYEVP